MRWHVPERYDQHGQDFALIARHARQRNEIKWHQLLPGDRLTGWLTPDPDKKTLKIDPAAGHDY